MKNVGNTETQCCENLIDSSKLGKGPGIVEGDLSFCSRSMARATCGDSGPAANSRKPYRTVTRSYDKPAPAPRGLFELALEVDAGSFRRAFRQTGGASTSL